MLLNPVIFCFISYLLGVIWGYYPGKPFFFLSLVPFSILVTGDLFLVRPLLSRDYLHRLILIILFSFLFTCMGYVFIQAEFTHIDELPPHHLTNYLSRNSDLAGSPIILLGQLIKPPEHFQQKTRLWLAVQKIILPEETLITSGIVQLDWYKAGARHQFYDTLIYDTLIYDTLIYDILMVRAKLRLPQDYQNPGGFSYVDYLHRQGISATGIIKDILMEIPSSRVPISKKIFSYLYQFKRSLSEDMARAVVWPESSLLQAILLGEKQMVPKRIKDIFSEAGIAHLMAISGLHLTALSMAVFFLIRLSLQALPEPLYGMITCFIKPTVLAAFLSLPFIPFYVILTGNRVSTIRAALMMSFYFLILFLEREKRLWSPLVLAAFCILLWQPEALFNADFQLTFLATSGILFMLEHRSSPSLSLESLPRKGHHLKRITLSLKKYFTWTIFLSGMTFLLTGPLTAYYFNLVSPVGVHCNLAAIPIISGMLWIGMGAMTAYPISPFISALLFRFGAWLGWLVIKISSLSIRLPFAFFYVPSPPKMYLALVYTSIIVALFSISRFSPKSLSSPKILLIVAIPSGFLFFLNLYSPRPQSTPPHMEVTFLDVGKGDACLIRTPQGKHLLIDGGGTYNNEFDIGRYVVAPYLWAKGIKKLDLIALSHPHPDHINGLLFILKTFPAGRIWKTKDRSDSPGYLDFEKITREKKIAVQHMVKGDQTSFDNIHIEVLAPEDLPSSTGSKKSYRKENNRSLVLKLTCRHVSFLFTGDIEWKAERDLVPLGRRLESTILKVPHHGSRSSSSALFLEQVSPRIAIFSARNYGDHLFPHPETLSRYQNLPCQIYRTDRDGAITVTTDGLHLSVTLENQRRAKSQPDLFRRKADGGKSHIFPEISPETLKNIKKDTYFKKKMDISLR